MAGSLRIRAGRRGKGRPVAPAPVLLKRLSYSAVLPAVDGGVLDPVAAIGIV